MAKSRIIKELANGEVSLYTALKRVKVLLQEFDNEELLRWVNCELVGYPTEAELPSYRIMQGQLRGTYFKGSLANNITYKDVPLPLGNLSNEQRDFLLRLPFYDGIEGLVKLVETAESGEINSSVQAEWYPLIAVANKDRYMNIVTARVVGPVQMVHNILSVVENRLLDILCYLEKQFGCLDELDIDVEAKGEEEKNEIIQHIHFLVYTDNRVSIGDNNRMKSVDIVANAELTN